MVFTPKHLWIAGILIWFLALAAAKIWPSKKSYAEFEQEYTEYLMFIHTGIPYGLDEKK